MANTYVITGITKMNDQYTVSGTVNGIAVVVFVWATAIAGMNVAQVEAFLAPLMLQAAIPAAPVVITTYNGTTWNQ
jgi:hypothetical protein